MNRIHVIPVGDEDAHAAQATCWCHPLDSGDGVWLHHAKDCREAHERQNGEQCSEGWVNIREEIPAFTPATVRAAMRDALFTSANHPMQYIGGDRVCYAWECLKRWLDEQETRRDSEKETI